MIKIKEQIEKCIKEGVKQSERLIKNLNKLCEDIQ